ncbi:MAG: serine/threonine-protein kinase, partial [Verrucomicrobia bacterium]|nr:serine/threonine-protein kinase [Verrucomicrobiota bacterium]
MAEQEKPIRRRVAFKVIKLGMDTKQVIARFEAERQALALMDHPNIAKVLDAGATETGRPYFVMELVRGVRITEYCDQNNLTTTERLMLFLQVCQAIQHAHQKGIIHRDIKPSNILVSVHDDAPVVKVIDFGIAKAIQQRLTDKTLFTQFQQFIGTPAYMSPEQAGLSGLDIDTRSDIYALGVLLYELLTGRTPFDTTRLLESGLDAILRAIRESEPPKPSTRLNTLTVEELTEIAARRQATPAKLNRLIRGELDSVVMKALETDRRRRYESAAAFADDLERWLDSKPILARPSGPGKRVAKWARRQPALAGLVGISVAAALLLIGMFAVSTMRIRAALNRERQSAYANGIALADRELSAGNLDGANRILEEDCQPHLRGWEWHYLKRLAAPELLAITAQLSPWRPSPSMSFSPDGQHLAVSAF